MKISIHTTALSAVLNSLSKSYHEDSVSILASRDAAVLTVDDLEARWALSVPATVEVPGQVHTSIKRLIACIPRADVTMDAMTSLTLTQTSLAFESATVSGQLPVLDASLFPAGRTLDKETAKTSSFERVSFQNAVNACLPAVAAGTGFEFTKGIYVSTTETDGFLLATDRKMVVRRRFMCKGDPLKFTVDAQQLSRVASQFGDTIICVADQRTTRFKNDRFIADLSQFTENAPDVAGQLVDSMRKCKEKALIPTGALVDALRICSSVGGERDKFLAYLDLSPQGCTLRANGDRIDELKIHLGGSATKEMKIYIWYPSFSRLIGSLSKLDMLGDMVDFKIDDDRSPFFIPFSSDQEFCLIGPVRPPGLTKEQ